MRTITLNAINRVFLFPNIVRKFPLFFFIISVPSCNETLPVREDVISQISTSVYPGFVRMNGENYLRIYVSIKNNIDETIEETATLTGSIEVTWTPKHPDEVPKVNWTRTFAITDANIHRAAGYNASTRTLRISPGDSIIFFVNWNMKTNDSSDISKYMKYFQENECWVAYDGFSRPRKISEMQLFNVSANISLFPRLAVLHVYQAKIQACYVYRYLGGDQTCANINIVNPCSLIK